MRPGLPRPVGGFPPRSPRKPVPPRLMEAHALMEDSRYLEAAELFESLAQRAQGLRSRRAPFLFLQAGRARLLGGEMEAGVGLLQKGMQLLAGAERWLELKRAVTRIDQELPEIASSETVETLHAWIEAQFPNLVGIEDAPVRPRPVMLKAHLPVKCGSCGAPVNPDEVEWTQRGVTPLCRYCGNSLREETE